MPGNDREQNFDKALARHLGPSSASHSANAQGNDCLDAETLAAYHDRLLSPEEMAQHKSHIASCERCQEILAQLEATDPIPVEADRDLLLDQIVLEIPESEPAGAAPPAALKSEPYLEPRPETKSEELPQPTPTLPIPQAETPAAAAPESESTNDLEIEHEPDLVAASAAPPSLTQSRAAASAAAAVAKPAAPVVASATKSAPPASSTITFRAQREERPKMVRYVAIFGALAAGLVFWLVFRDQTKPVDVAQNHQQKLEMPPQSSAPPPPVADKQAQSSPSGPDAAATQTQSSAPAPTSAQPERDKSKLPADSFDNSLDDAKKTLDSAKSIEKKSRKDAAAAASTFIPRQEEPAALSASASRAARTAPAPSPRAAAANASPVDKALADANAVLQSASNSPSSIPATPPPARTKMNPGVITEAASHGGAQLSTSADALSLPTSGRVVNTLSTLTPLSVPAPSGKTIWRIGQAGMVQRSTDSGATWVIQPSGVVIDLIAGSAYSDQVCWLVGRNGTILRTINGGASWQKLASPSNVDLLGIFSINADSATITDAAGRAFETTTAGSRWTRTRLQQ